MARQALPILVDTINESISNSDEIRQESWWSYSGRSDDMSASRFYELFSFVSLSLLFLGQYPLRYYGRRTFAAYTNCGRHR